MTVGDLSNGRFTKHFKLMARVPHGKCKLSVALTGHTDERGTREYNMALGERRAKAVQNTHYQWCKSSAT